MLVVVVGVGSVEDVVVVAMVEVTVSTVAEPGVWACDVVVAKGVVVLQLPTSIPTTARYAALFALYTVLLRYGLVAW